MSCGQCRAKLEAALAERDQWRGTAIHNVEESDAREREWRQRLAAAERDRDDWHETAEFFKRGVAERERLWLAAEKTIRELEAKLDAAAQAQAECAAMREACAQVVNREELPHFLNRSVIVQKIRALDPGPVAWEFLERLDEAEGTIAIAEAAIESTCGLEAKLAAAEKERDEWRARWNKRTDEITPLLFEPKAADRANAELRERLDKAEGECLWRRDGYQRLVAENAEHARVIEQLRAELERVKERERQGVETFDELLASERAKGAELKECLSEQIKTSARKRVEVQEWRDRVAELETALRVLFSEHTDCASCDFCEPTHAALGNGGDQ